MVRLDSPALLRGLTDLERSAIISLCHPTCDASIVTRRLICTGSLRKLQMTTLLAFMLQNSVWHSTQHDFVAVDGFRQQRSAT